MNFTEFRLKVRRFLRKNGKIISIFFILWIIVFLVNLIMKLRPQKFEATTTYAKHTSVMDTGSNVPTQVSSKVEDLIEEYVGYCNEGNYQKAFSMLSEDCREYGFNNDIVLFMEHVLTKMPTPKKYAIQDYSNTTIGNNRVYIYQVKYTDDFLSTGLTGEEYLYTEEKFLFKNGKDGIEMSVGDYMYYTKIQGISENEYLKIDVIDKVVNYSIETYRVKITNKSNYTVVVSDGAEADEVILNLPNEYRNRSEVDHIVLQPGETKELEMVFKKFVDDGDNSLALTFSLIRVMEHYSGVDDDIPQETIQDEIDNAIAKFSMSVNLRDK